MKKEYKGTNYESDLTDKQWEEIEGFFPSGNKSKYHKRSMVEAVLYIVKTGCQWRMLPHDYPPYTAVMKFLPLPQYVWLSFLISILCLNGYEYRL